MAAKEIQLNFKLMEKASSNESEDEEEVEESEEVEEEEEEAEEAEEEYNVNEDPVDTDLNVEVYKELSSPQHSHIDENKVQPRFAISHKLSIIHFIKKIKH